MEGKEAIKEWKGKVMDRIAEMNDKLGELHGLYWAGPKYYTNLAETFLPDDIEGLDDIISLLNESPEMKFMHDKDLYEKNMRKYLNWQNKNPESKNTFAEFVGIDMKEPKEEDYADL